MAKLGEIFTFIDYRGKNPKKASSGHRLITAKNIRMGTLINEPIEYVSERTYQSWMTRGFPRVGDLLFVTEGHTMGFVALVNRDDEFALAQRIITLQPPNGIASKYFFYYLMSPIGQRIVKLNATGSAAQGVKGARLRDFAAPFPSLAEQIEITRKIDEMFEHIHGVEESMKMNSRYHQTRDQSILSKAFRGELVPQDPNDEPAAVLLERIRAQREEAETNGMKKREKTSKKKKK